MSSLGGCDSRAILWYSKHPCQILALSRKDRAGICDLEHIRQVWRKYTGGIFAIWNKIPPAFGSCSTYGVQESLCLPTKFVLVSRRPDRQGSPISGVCPELQTGASLELEWSDQNTPIFPTFMRINLTSWASVTSVKFQLASHLYPSLPSYSKQGQFPFWAHFQ